MAARNFEFKLRHQGREMRDPEPFQRGVDFDQVLEADRLLLILFVGMVKRARLDPRKDLDECDMEVWDVERRVRVRVFAASRHEVTDDLLS